MGRGGTESFFVLIGLRTVFAKALPKALFLTILVLTQAAIAQTSSPPACVAVPFGAVAWWRAQSNTVDTIGVNDGLPQGARLSVTSYTLGRVGAAFHFPAPILGPPPLVKTTNYIFVPPVPDLDIGQGQGLTVEGWIKPDSLSGVRPIIEWNDGHENIGAGLALSGSSLQGYLAKTNPLPIRRIVFSSQPGLISTQAWQHVALTWDKGSGLAILYLNGASVGQTNLGVFAPQTHAPVYIAFRPSGASARSFYLGGIDEMTIYNRALTAAEIQSIVAAAEAGKCVPPPPSCVPPPSGFVGWWRGESNALDSVDSNNGITTGTVGYTNGEVGKAFEFGALVRGNGYVRIPASSNLNVGAGPGFTLETWVAPALPVGFGGETLQFVGWHSGVVTQGVSLSVLNPPPLPLAASPVWQANLVDTQFHSHVLRSPEGLATPGVYQHVAVTYDKTSGVAVLYFNGNPVTQTNLGVFTPRTTADLYLGYQSSSVIIEFPIGVGAMDEVSLYARALTPSEIRAIMLSRGAGKCKEPPGIKSQPASIRVNAGSDATFAVTASGNPLLRYQWRRNGANLLGATTTSLILTNVQLAQTGTYSVRVTNAFGTALSSNAVLALNHAPVADASATTPLVMVPLDCAPSVVLDGSRSSDPDGDPLHYFWFQSGAPTPIAAGVVAVVTLPVGTNSLILSVDDGLATNSQSFVVDVITPGDAVESLIALVEAEAPKPHPLIASLNAAAKSIERGHGGSAINQLQAFQHKVHAQVEKSDPDLAAEFTRAAQDIIDILGQDCSSSAKPHGHVGKVHHGNGKPHLQFTAPQGFTYIIEASTNLVDWERIGVATNSAPGEFEFEDANAPQAPARFYRVVVP